MLGPENKVAGRMQVQEGVKLCAMQEMMPVQIAGGMAQLLPQAGVSLTWGLAMDVLPDNGAHENARSVKVEACADEHIVAPQCAKYPTGREAKSIVLQM